MSQTITLYVDGACKGNPGLGGWGAYIITQESEHKLYGGEAETTNNRMELTAAIEGVSFCPIDAKLIIWTDSNYVKQGITEWIHGWKKKNWKDVKNPDLWQRLDKVCTERDIEWNWIKGHAGHAGNEMADQLANLGVLQPEKQHVVVPQSEWIGHQLSSIQAKKKSENDWLLDDPFGLDIPDDQFDSESLPEDENANELNNIVEIKETISMSETQEHVKNHPHIVTTAATLHIQGPRQLILDTETTGFYFQDGDRIIEVGAIEMINRKLTGSSIHIYINPEKPVGESENIHGISDDFLKDKPKYAEIADVLFDYLKGAEIIAHNATFDMNFLDTEFKRVGLPTLSEVCDVTDTLALAKSKHPGQKNSLDALVRRYDIPARDRTFHGALLDAEILSDVYLAMTGGQVSFDMDALSQHENHGQKSGRQRVQIDLPVILPEPEELERHETWVKQFEEKQGKACFFAK
ncbi:DNA polymerase III subunit epsilon [Acinetobacter sp. S40]|uniref:DNA polymerase III subunit epsilon n=1 Tax=unclassified Acinetobacter TaxID=196816 RepID=UPI00190D5044|nr:MULTISPECIES: DNA polymerase III subunit epsilon [unclassified Acinetobacter]MBJ9985789.1 DNA polymerase III subunit epsilon [Acinetobacter sp. S40]MBK0064830.1 DNA polymerase III subunit epsilon [Acinetobacter sp. S55]MBK0068500.1 DNA polymerase III subunit epsilon [Acinetobacter sp. S54]